MANQVYGNVIKALVDNGIHEDFAHMYLRKGLKLVEANEDTIDEKAMGIVLQQHVFNAIQMFVDVRKAENIIHKVTLRI